MALFAPTTVSTTSEGARTVSYPPWVEEPTRRYVQRAEAASLSPYTPFGGPRIAPLTEQQQRAINLTSAGVGAAGRGFDEARGYLTSALEAPTTAGIAGFIDPYNKLVTKDIVRELDRRNELAAQRDAAQAARVGAFGGSRTGVVEGMRRREHERLISDVLSQRGSEAFQQAQQQFNRQQQFGIQGALGLGDLTQARQAGDIKDIVQLLSTGNLQYGLNQANLDLAYQDFLRQQQYPYQQASYLGSALGVAPTPSTTMSTGTESVPGPSIGQQIGGVTLGTLGLLGQLPEGTLSGVGGFLGDVATGVGDFLGGAVEGIGSFLGF